MLNEISIQNFAIIDRLLVRFGSGLTVLTGETGAGKSIIVDALQVALGGRSSSDMVRTDAKLAAVEAVFDWPDESNLQAVLEEAGIADEGCLILRREITPAGRSTARINGHAVPLSTLGSVGALLVDIHGQSDHLSILRRDRQLDALDRFAGLLELRAEAATAIRSYTHLRAELEEMQARGRTMAQRLDLLRFQVDEIESADLLPHEEEDLEAERRRLANAERLAELAAHGYNALMSESSPALEGVIGAMGAAHDLAAIDPNLAPLALRLEAARYELEDAAEEFRRYRDAVEFDPQRLDLVQQRLDSLARLRRKYGRTIPEVIEFGTRARAEMEAVEHLDETLDAMGTSVADAERSAADLAGRLSTARAAAALDLRAAMSTALQGLGLRNASFEVVLTQQHSASGLPVAGYASPLAHSSSGVDTATFQVSFNPGEPLRPLDRVASGGETSRFLLALKSVLAETDRTPTLIFDEVDVGVGSRNGMVVGDRLKDLSRSHQVISITHLPQVAALGDQHIHVVKTVHGDHTAVGIRQLEEGDRVAELAEMMSGTGSEASLRNAEELLAQARRDS